MNGFLDGFHLGFIVGVTFIVIAQAVIRAILAVSQKRRDRYAAPSTARYRRQ